MGDATPARREKREAAVFRWRAARHRKSGAKKIKKKNFKWYRYRYRSHMRVAKIYGVSSGKFISDVMVAASENLLSARP
jgi:hypothetical protein